MTFDVRRGEIVGLLGPNGAGKTTLIRMIIDIFPPDQGEIRFLGRAMSDTSDHGGAMRDLLGYLPEERGLYRRGRLAEVLEYVARLHGVPPPEARRRVTEGLEALGFAAYAKRRIADLSKGMTQRVQFLLASLHRPRLMILDEPFSGLDPVGVQWALDQIRSFRDQGATILLSAHQMHMVERLCDRVVMINEGHRVLYGTLAEIRGAHGVDRAIVTTEVSLDEVQAARQLSVRRVAPSQWEIMLGSLSARDLLRRLVQADVPLSTFTVREPTLEEIFLQVVTSGTRR